MSDFIITSIGRRFWPLEPTNDQVHLEDIASALSKMCRFTCHIKSDDIYSVAQHAVYVSHLVPVGYALEALHHDSSEAYLTDVASPVKHAPGFMEVYRRHEDALTAVIYSAFDVPFTGNMHPSIKEADHRMLVTEARDLMPVPIDGGWESTRLNMADAYEFRITVWSPREARHRFTQRHNELMAARRAA
jgi:uncharacterized protein